MLISRETLTRVATGTFLGFALGVVLEQSFVGGVLRGEIAGGDPDFFGDCNSSVTSIHSSCLSSVGVQYPEQCNREINAFSPQCTAQDLCMQDQVSGMQGCLNKKIFCCTGTDNVGNGVSCTSVPREEALNPGSAVCNSNTIMNQWTYSTDQPACESTCEALNTWCCQDPDTGVCSYKMMGTEPASCPNGEDKKKGFACMSCGQCCDLGQGMCKPNPF